MNNRITIETLLGIAVGFISAGVALVTAEKILIGVIITAIGFLLIFARAMLKKFNC
jgi:hypothetical protein